MMTASIGFLTSHLLADLPCKGSELRTNLQNIGILTPPDLITLDNARTLQIQLTPTDQDGQLLYSLVDTNKDTLGRLNRLCRYVYCLNGQRRELFMRKLRMGEIKSVEQGLQVAEYLYIHVREPMRV